MQTHTPIPARRRHSTTEIEVATMITYLVDNIVYLKMYRDTDRVVRILGFSSLHAGLEYFEKAYRESHARGATWSTGAAIGWLETQPRIHENVATTEIERLCEGDPRVFTLSGMATFGELALRLTHPEARAFHDAGHAPKLVP